jgi:glycopeptide antibiotics resistance protein
VGKKELPMISNYESQNQLRKMYFGAVVLTILLGIASRKYSHLLFSFIAENAGDVLWAMMVYFGFRFLLVNKSMITAFLLSFLFSFGIEFSQLYQEDWMNQIRGTLLGALILGKGFLLVDLIRYSTGIVIAYSLDRLVSIKKQKNI